MWDLWSEVFTSSDSNLSALKMINLFCKNKQKEGERFLLKQKYFRILLQFWRFMSKLYFPTQIFDL